MLDLCALVTGASRGLGQATAARFAAAGYRVAITGRNEARLKIAADSMRTRPGHVLTLAGDVGDPDTVRDQFGQIMAEFGRLDVVVNNAGDASPHFIGDITDQDAIAQINTNLLGAIWVCREAVTSMQSAGGGHIINVSSESARAPLPMLSVYAAAKAGLETLTLSLANEVRADGIRVSLFRAGRTAGGFSAHWSTEQRDRARAVWERGGYLSRRDPNRTSAADAAAMLFAVASASGTGYVTELSVQPLA